MENKQTANYRVISDSGGFCVRFFCDLSGARVCTAGSIQADTPEQALEIAWETAGKREFNRCEKCGKWISDVMFNTDVHQCVECAPWENYPLYCPQCGKKIADTKRFCSRCGARLRYEGE